MALFPDPHRMDAQALVEGWTENIAAGEMNTNTVPPYYGGAVPMPPSENDSESVRDSPPPDDALGAWITSNPIEMRHEDTYLY